MRDGEGVQGRGHLQQPLEVPGHRVTAHGADALDRFRRGVRQLPLLQALCQEIQHRL